MRSFVNSVNKTAIVVQVELDSLAFHHSTRTPSRVSVNDALSMRKVLLFNGMNNIFI